MSRTSLAERLWIAGDPSSPILFTPSKHESVAGLCAAGADLPLSSQQRRGAVVLRLSCPLKTTVALAALDGSANRLFLLSTDTEVKTADELIRRFDPDVVVTDEADYSTQVATVVHWTTELSRGAPRPNVATGKRDTLWILATSGTTDVPKLVAHRLDSLTRTTKVSQGASSGWRWGLLFGPARFAGVQVMLQGLLGGGGLIAPDPAAELSEQVQVLVEAGCTAMSATPTMWRKLLMTSETGGLKLRQVTLGGEIADDAVLKALANRFPQARITHIYASTEAGTAFSVTDGKAGFPASYLSAPPLGVRLRIVHGRLAVQNSSLAPEYVGDARKFVDADGFIDTGDVVELVDDRYYFRGRENGAINVGGNKVYPEEVERLLLAHGAVGSARVFGINNPITGQLVAAEVVIHPGCLDSGRVIAELRASCRASLQPFKVPASLKIVSALPSNAGGKIVRSGT